MGWCFFYCAETVFKENNNLVLSGKDYLDSFLVGALSVGALHAKSTAIGLSTDVIGSLYKMKNSKGQHLPNETLKAYLTNNATEADIQKIDKWAKDVKAEDIDKMTDDMKNIASVKIGGIAYGDISKATANMDSRKKIEFLYEVMNSPEYKIQTEKMKKQSSAALDEGEGVKVGNALVNINNTTPNSMNKKSDINNVENKENDVFNKGEALSNQDNPNIDNNNRLKEYNLVNNDTIDNANELSKEYSITDSQHIADNVNESNLNNLSVEENKENIPKSDIIKYKDGDKLFNVLDDYFENPKIFGKATPQQLHDYLHNNGFKPQPLSDGRYKNKPHTEGGGYKVNWGGDKILEYHPAGLNHHGNEEYFKISSGKTGKIWFDIFGNPIPTNRKKD